MRGNRLNLEMTLSDCIAAVAGGNPGAISVCVQAIKNGAKIDPDSAFGGLAIIMDFDTYNITGERVWMLYKDVCRENLNDMMTVLRATQLGFVDIETVQHAIDNRGAGLDIVECRRMVKERLPRFQISA